MPIIRNFNNPDLVPMDNFIEARKNDLIRVTDMLNSGKGLIFAGKQTLLRTSPALAKLVNPKSTPQERLDAGKQAVFAAAEAASHIATILAQVPVNGTGTHFLYNDILRLVRQNDQLYYTGNGNAANEALYGGVITVRKGSKVRGAKLLDTAGPDGFGFGRAGDADEVGQSGIGTVGTELIKKDTVPVVFSIAGDTLINSQLVFRGFIDGLSNSYSAQWQGVSYVGRGETMYTYTNSSRGLSFRLQIPIFSKKEQVPVYQKLNSLISHTTPKYVDNLPQGTITSLRIGDYFQQYCVITSIVDTVALDVPWSGDGTENEILLPQVVTLQISANVIHNNLPTRFTKEDLDNAQKPSSLPYTGYGLKYGDN